MSDERTEFGYSRTYCSCDKCVKECQRGSGYLVPADLERMHLAIAPELEPAAFIAKYLDMGKGAIVGSSVTQMRAIPTIVIKKDVNTGHCIFLKEGKCSIHAVAPFGCAFFDHSIGKLGSDARSSAGLKAIVSDGTSAGPYVKTLCMVAALNPEALRKFNDAKAMVAKGDLGGVLRQRQQP